MIEQDYESNIATRESEHIHASDEYFKARPQIDSNDRRKVFEAGFERAWQAAIERQRSNTTPQQSTEVANALAEVADMCESMALYTGIDCADAIRNLITAPQHSPIPQGWVKTTESEELPKNYEKVPVMYKGTLQIMSHENGWWYGMGKDQKPDAWFKLHSLPSAPIEAQRSYADGLEAAASLLENQRYMVLMPAETYTSQEHTDALKYSVRSLAKRIRALIPSTQAPDKP